MKIVGSDLIIDEPMGNEAAQEFLDTVTSQDIKQVIIENPDLGSSIVQILMRLKREKNIIVEDIFLKKFFENIKYS